ncbi:MAG: NAD(P)H-hydrate dehydratase [Coxiellaceae bacterium]|nr:NAD(P)H-hydrate dehydratase [Coxiellaceae bacterium]
MSNSIDGQDVSLLYQTEQIRQLEQWGVEHGHMTEALMMQTAGESAFECLRKQFPDTQAIAICCGKGNNAGDGFVLAEIAARIGLSVSCFLMCSPTEVKQGPARDAAIRCSELSIDMHTLSTDSDFSQSDLIVDALLGIGLSGEVNDSYKVVIEHINHAGVPVVALDCPSGIDVDTGEALGASIKADTTVSFIAAKFGLYTHQGLNCSGKVIVADLGFTQQAIESVEPVAKVMQASEIQPLLPRRCRDGHKGNYGHVLVIGGDYGMGGAVRMAAEAALRSGAGLVSVATRPEHVTVVNATRPEIMCHEIVNSEDILPLAERANVIVLGPGLGQAEWSQGLFDIITEKNLPKVMDADCLNILSTNPKQRDDWILTPHPGEASRLLDVSCAEVQADRLGCVHQLQQRYGGVAILKGAGTLVQAPGELTAVCNAGNPGMATAGMGDILSGILGGLLAQGLTLEQAASAGVWVHAHAADIAAEIGGERGMLATDVLAHLREVVNPR